LEREIEECFAKLRKSLDDRERAVLKDCARRTLHKRQALEKQRDWVSTKKAEGARVHSMATRLATANEEELVLFSTAVLQHARRLQLDGPAAGLFDDPTRLAATDAHRLVVNVEHEIDRIKSIGGICDEDEAKLYCWGWDEMAQPALRHARPSVAATRAAQSPASCSSVPSTQQTDETDATPSASAVEPSCATVGRDWEQLIFPELAALGGCGNELESFDRVDASFGPSVRDCSVASVLKAPDRVIATPTSYRSDSRLLGSPPRESRAESRASGQPQATGMIEHLEAPADVYANLKLAQRNLFMNWDNAPLVDVRRVLYRQLRSAAGHHGEIQKLNPYTKGWVTEVWQPGAETYGQGVLSFYTLDDWDSGLCWSCCRQHVFTTLRECFGLAHPWSTRRPSSSRYDVDDVTQVEDGHPETLLAQSNAGEPNLATAV
jgi:hypothetical protein